MSKPVANSRKKLRSLIASPGIRLVVIYNESGNAGQWNRA